MSNIFGVDPLYPCIEDTVDRVVHYRSRFTLIILAISFIATKEECMAERIPAVSAFHRIIRHNASQLSFYTTQTHNRKWFRALSTDRTKQI